MIIDNNPKNKSAFLTVNKDMRLIADKILASKPLQKLLYYTTNDALSKPDLTNEQVIGLFGKNIKNVPKIYVDNEVLNYVIINFDNFTPNDNSEFRDHIIEFDIMCHFDQWALKDFDLRPYRIAAEIDSKIDKQHLTGIGEARFLGCNQMILNDELAGLCLMYQSIHSTEDQY